jgi:hypothetical protein
MSLPLQTLLNAQIATALEDKSVRDQLTGFGLEVPARGENTVAALTRHIDDFQLTYGKLITALGIEPQ